MILILQLLTMGKMQDNCFLSYFLFDLYYSFGVSYFGLLLCFFLLIFIDLKRFSQGCLSTRESRGVAKDIPKYCPS